MQVALNPWPGAGPRGENIMMNQQDFDNISDVLAINKPEKYQSDPTYEHLLKQWEETVMGFSYMCIDNNRGIFDNLDFQTKCGLFDK